MSFADIEGHEQPKRILLRAVANDTVAHAYLFSGESGIGKKMTALAFAAAVNCGNRGAAGGCGACPSCRQTAAFSHPDIQIIMPESENERLLATWSNKEAEKASDVIKIEQIRQAQQSLYLTPTGSGKKVLIVDSAETLNDQAQNAFLKTLEEPPGSSLIILVSSRPQSLLPTIRSRCQEIAFRTLSRPLLARMLERRRGLSGEDAWFLAALAGGRVGAALEMDVQQELEARGQTLELWGGLKRMSPAEVLVHAETLARDRERLERFLDTGVEWLRDTLVYRETGEKRLLVNEQTHGTGGAWAEDMPDARLLSDLDLFIESRELIGRNVSAQLVTEHLLLSLGRP